MIELVDVTKRFPLRPTFGRTPEGVTALRDVSLRVPRGAVWAFVGPNGAGKSTLFGVLLGFLRPTVGVVRIDGAAPRDWLRRNGASYLPDRFLLPGSWPVRTALVGYARMDGQGAGAATAADAALERFGLTAHADRTVATLSRGLLQRLALAQALLVRRDLIVLDEPTQGLDPLWRVRFRDLVDELRAGGVTVLLASHDIAEVERMADRVAVLREGVVVDVLDATPPPGEQSWVLRLHSPSAALATAFPDAAPLPGEELAWLVRTTDPVELSRRLAALLAAGAVLAGIAPASESLEERVRGSLEKPGDAS
jgi:ABC-type multidrug transport system ATPase subunit